MIIVLMLQKKLINDDTQKMKKITMGGKFFSRQNQERKKQMEDELKWVGSCFPSSLCP